MNASDNSSFSSSHHQGMNNLINLFLYFFGFYSQRSSLFFCDSLTLLHLRPLRNYCTEQCTYFRIEHKLLYTLQSAFPNYNRCFKEYNIQDLKDLKYDYFCV
jgi:hypothetical protein